MDEDAVQIAAYYACDDTALESLVVRRHPALVGFFENRGLAGEEAVACAQEVWIRVIETKVPPEGRSPRPFDPIVGTPLLAWLFSIARNLLLDAQRRSLAAPAQFPTVNGEDFEQAIPAPESAPEGPLVAQEVSEEIQSAYSECLNELSPAHREVFLLEMERRNIEPPPEQRNWATSHGLTAGQYTSRLNKAREQMRECMRARLQED